MLLQLPVELKLMVLRLLPREDLLNTLTVSKELKALAHPLFYERMLFTKAGFAFPHAPNPYPFLDIPNLKVPAPVSDSDREGIISGVRSITVPSHYFAICAGWQNLQQRHLLTKTDVLTINLAYPSLDGIACCHKPISCGRCGNCQMGHDEDEEDSSHPYPECGFVDALRKLTARKIIVKNYPVLLNGESSTILPQLADKASEFVVVLEPYSLMSKQFGEAEYFADTCPDGTENLGASALMSMIPPNVTDLTLIFKTCSPESEWSPFCKHYNYEWYERGCSTPCPCGGGCHDSNSFFDDYEEEQQSCWQSAFWKDLASGVADSKARITIVNSSAIIPDGVNRFETLDALRNRNKRPTVRKQFLRALRKAHDTKDAYEKRLSNVRLLSMESWILSGASEDVFDRKEISRWLEHVEQRKAKAKAKVTTKKTPMPAKATDPETIMSAKESPASEVAVPVKA